VSGVAAFVPPRFARLEVIEAPFDREPPELDWLESSLADEPRAVLWQAAQGLVVPLSYRRHETLDEVGARFAAQGWPVRLRKSGGGVVPQGPGIVNLSFAYRVDASASLHAEAAYVHLCGVLSHALRGLGVEAQALAVEGSFCDGRYNLAVDGSAGPRKIAGTAQYWRRRGERHAVLAHALLLVDADVRALTDIANEFEDALGSGRRYQADVLTTVAMEQPRLASPRQTLAERIAAALGVRSVSHGAPLPPPSP
jgi:lipoate-protein ligase A